MDEHLVGYLLGSLDPVTHAQVEAHAASSEQTRHRLHLLRQALAPLEEIQEDPEPPPSLIINTLARIAEHRCRRIPAAPQASLASLEPTSRWSIRRVDSIVAALLLILVGGLLAPLAIRQWHMHQRLACENNLRKFWVALENFADQNEGEFPRVANTGPRAVAGIFLPTLLDHGLAQDVTPGCPSTRHTPVSNRSLAELDRLHQQSPDEHRAALRLLAGNYAYTLGYVEGNRFLGLNRDSSDGLPILADLADDSLGQSGNHSSRGQNVLYVGGNVRWAVQPTVGLECDNIYVNRRNLVGAGLGRVDSVLAAGDCGPRIG
ncbi:MAG: anti-sigma factor family protein, partial [Gemmataceae bacterium]